MGRKADLLITYGLRSMDLGMTFDEAKAQRKDMNRMTIQQIEKLFRDQRPAWDDWNEKRLAFLEDEPEGPVVVVEALVMTEKVSLGVFQEWMNRAVLSIPQEHQAKAKVEVVRKYRTEQTEIEISYNLKGE